VRSSEASRSGVAHVNHAQVLFTSDPRMSIGGSLLADMLPRREGGFTPPGADLAQASSRSRLELLAFGRIRPRGWLLHSSPRARVLLKPSESVTLVGAWQKSTRLRTNLTGQDRAILGNHFKLVAHRGILAPRSAHTPDVARSSNRISAPHMARSTRRLCGAYLCRQGRKPRMSFHPQRHEQ
jgi:hypothetical protein